MFTVGTTKVLNLPEQVEENRKNIATINTDIANVITDSNLNPKLYALSPATFNNISVGTNAEIDGTLTLNSSDNITFSEDSSHPATTEDILDINKKIGGVAQSNYLDNNSLVPGYYDGSDSTIKSFSSWYSTTEYQAAPPVGTTLYYYLGNGTTYSKGQWRCIQYNANKEYISNTFINGTAASAGTGVTISENCAYIRFSVLCSTATNIYYIMITASSDTPTSFAAYGTYNSLQAQISTLKSAVTSPLSNMPLLTCGDSITQGATITPVNGVRHAFGYWISSWYNMELENQGVGGATIGLSSTTTQYHFIEHYQEILSNYEGEEFYLTLFYGENDGVAINNGYETVGTFDSTYNGTATLDTSSFIGAYQTVLWYILNTDTLNKCHLLVILPRSNRQSMNDELVKMLIAYQIKFYDFYAFNQPGFFGFGGSERNTHLTNFYIPAAGADYATTNSTMNSRFQSLYISDGTHPTEYGQKVLARRLIPYLLSC